jgi:hypothetical protein
MTEERKITKELEIPSSLSTGVEGGVDMGGGTLAATSNNGLVSCASAFSCYRDTYLCVDDF